MEGHQQDRPDSGAEGTGGVGARPPAQAGARRGWQLPGRRDQPGVPPGEASVPDGGRAEPQPGPSLRHSVIGQVTDVREGTLQSNQVSVPVANYRLERHDPRAGRDFVASVRLRGSDALGFADVGDWLEAVGKRRSAHLLATHCVNHTTGAVYERRTARIVVPIVVALVVLVALAGAAFFVFDQFDDNAGPQRDDSVRERAVQQCLDSGAPRDFCEGIP